MPSVFRKLFLVFTDDPMTSCVLFEFENVQCSTKCLSYNIIIKLFFPVTSSIIPVVDIKALFRPRTINQTHQLFTIIYSGFSHVNFF